MQVKENVILSPWMLAKARAAEPYIYCDKAQQVRDE